MKAEEEERRLKEEKEGNHRDQEAQRRQQFQEMERMLQDEEFIASLDPKVEEHARLLQEVQFRKREAEIKRRTEERKKRSDKQRESRRKQEKIEAEIRMRAASMPLSQEARMFLYHERLWHRIALPEADSKKLTWSDIPWPVAMNPRSPEEISQHLVVAYMQSSFWAENDSVKSAKKRIKESLRRWHPDRFDQICLARVIDSDKECGI
ncbi:hypothetical protein M413DRAFT_79642 [Hebeloma cylindrosporum]|uniref:J domain-containing protein n=1 Tax=Hebeloma cylindrosporum TaxID=76867 RepID=A0A0C3BEJ5_HEBCY|nr:hypothetical protein M413DRAFT_79642 [Hebeloma cylindrosporum h7]